MMRSGVKKTGRAAALQSNTKGFAVKFYIKKVYKTIKDNLIEK